MEGESHGIILLSLLLLRDAWTKLGMKDALKEWNEKGPSRLDQRVSTDLSTWKECIDSGKPRFEWIEGEKVVLNDRGTPAARLGTRRC